MTDVLKIALERRAELQHEVERIDAFIRMADNLLRSVQASREQAGAAVRDSGLPRELREAFREPQTVLPPEFAADATSPLTRVNVMRRGPTAIDG